MTRRLLPLLVFAAGLGVGGMGVGGMAWSQDRPGLSLDPQQPPGALSGECVTRRVTGPGGAYRWDRVECAGEMGWNDFDRWGHGRPLQVQDGPQGGVLRGDRYGGRPRVQGDDDRYGAAYPIYRVAGRDADGFLIWPGKRP